MEDRRLVMDNVDCLRAVKVLEKFWDANGKTREAVEVGEEVVAPSALELCRTINLRQQ